MMTTLLCFAVLAVNRCFDLCLIAPFTLRFDLWMRERSTWSVTWTLRNGQAEVKLDDPPKFGSNSALTCATTNHGPMKFIQRRQLCEFYAKLQHSTFIKRPSIDF
jgi:hypothetical protein